MVRYSENDDNEEDNKIKVKFRYYKDEERDCGDDLINSYDLSLGEAKEDLDKFNQAINCFLENGGKRSDLEYLLN